MPRRALLIAAGWLLLAGLASAQEPFSEPDPALNELQRLEALDPGTRAQLIRYLQQSEVPPAPAAESEHPEQPKDNELNPAVVAQGQAAFQSYCVTCHDAARSLNKHKSLSGWLSTVRRMAAKPDAGIPSGSFTAIATYLTSVAGATGNEGPLASARSVFDGSSFTPNLTVSTMLRGADQHNVLNNDFFADVWMGADWQPQGPLSATVMACTSCHSDVNLSQGYSLELVEGSATLDFLKLVDPDHGRDGGNCTSGACGCECPAGGWKAQVKAGRFVVPFGAFASMAHPGVYRTLDNPLMFDMGRRYSPNNGIRYLPVLPGPYSDEGVNFELGAPLAGDFAANLQVYAVNGLQGDRSMSFPDSRAYYDNNRTPGAGARLTLGNKSLKIGGSLMGGQMQDDGASDRLFYELYGVDLVYRHEDDFRFYFEYAARQSDFKPRDAPEYFKGIVAEGEVRIIKEPRVGLLARYDTLDQHRYIVFPDSSIQRYTWGFTIALPGPSSLLLNHEIWKSADFGTFHLIGARWVATF